MIENDSVTVRAYLSRNGWQRLRLSSEEMESGKGRVQIVRARIASGNSLARATLCGCLVSERALRARIIRKARAQGGALLSNVRAFYARKGAQ